MKNFVDSELLIISKYNELVYNKFYKTRFGIKQCITIPCPDLTSIRYELLQWQLKKDCIIISPETPAIVNAGSDQILQLPINTGVLTGTYTAGSNPIVSVLWEKLSGPSISIANPNSQTTNYIVNGVGTYVIRFSVIDNKGNKYYDLLTIKLLQGQRKVYFGYKTNNNILTESQIVTSQSINITINQLEYILPVNQYSQAGFIWFAEPISEPIKTKWQDTIVSYNNGLIGTDNDLFGEESIVESYRFYQTEYQTQFSYPIKIS